MLQTEIDYVENEILQTPKRDWKPDYIEPFSNWFYECGMYPSCVKLLMRGSYLLIKDKFIPIKNEPQAIAEELVQDGVIKFVYDFIDNMDKRFDPSDAPFNFYFKRGLKFLARNSQKKGSSFKIKDERFRVGYEYLDSVNNDNFSILQELEAKGELIDTNYFEIIRQLEIKELVDLAIDNADSSNKNIQAALLRYLDDLEYSEIARIMGITENNAYQMVKRGLCKILKAISEILKEQVQSGKKAKGDQK